MKEVIFIDDYKNWKIGDAVFLDTKLVKKLLLDKIVILKKVTKKSKMMMAQQEKEGYVTK